MSLAGLAIKRPVTVSMFLVAMVIFGLYSAKRLPVELLPNISYPTLTIRTTYPQAAPSEVEEFVTKPIEEIVAAVTNVVRVSSVSKAGLSDVMVDFAWGTKMDMAAFDVREKVQMIASMLPEDVEDPVILRFDPTLDPVLTAGITSNDRDISELRTLTERLIQRPLEPIPGVASVKVAGGLEEEIEVAIDESRLSALGIAYSQVVNRLAEENVNMTGGNLEDAGATYLVRTVNQFKTWEEIGDIILSKENGTIRMKDVSQVLMTHKRRTRIARIDGQSAIELEIYKEGDANTLTICSSVLSTVDKIRGDLPADMKIVIGSDQSSFIKNSIREVCWNGIYGGLFATLILYLFLRGLRNTVIITISIPLSVVATFNLMYLSTITLNMMSLGGLALGMGMLVDNAVVILENIHRHSSMGSDFQEASRKGTDEVMMAVTASTFASIAVFYPIVYVQGIAGQIFKDQAITVAYIQIVSLGIALTLVPMLASRLAGQGEGSGHESPRWLRELLHLLSLPMKWVCDGFDYGFGWIVRAYPPALRVCIDNPYKVVAVSAVVFLLFMCAVPFLGVELLPAMDQGQFMVDVMLPQDKPIESTDELMGRMETICLGCPEVLHLFTSVGAGSAAGSASDVEGENIGQFTLSLRPKRERTRTSGQLMAALREEFSKIAGVEFAFREPALFSLRTPIEIEIGGQDLGVLKDLSARARDLVKGITGLGELDATAEAGYPEVHVVVDREKASALGLSVREIADQLRGKIKGRVATRFSGASEDIDVLVRVDEPYRQNVENLKLLAVTSPIGSMVPLASLAELEVSEGPSVIHRVGQHRVALLSGIVTGRDLGGVAQDIRTRLGRQPLPPGYSIEVKGQTEEMKRSFDSLKFALLLAVILVYVVMASQFESLIHPFVIMFSIPFGLVGVVGALVLTGQTISVVVFIGGIILAGIVVNNAIVLVDFANQLRRSGLPRREALLQAGPIRLRPILMTTGSTVLGLIPLALGSGDGSEMNRALASTIMGGIISSTVLNLLVTPSVYMILDSLLDRRRSGEDH